ncbi:NAD(P)/FAD-dependent oxidoreductase [bacterium]|nr:NAD(P)/FAD-dependent oxidoreductase [bacterium]
MHDVIVVGAGPSGSSSALFLARRGLDVLIIEKKRLPRYKVCAGGTSRYIFELLGVPPSYFDAFNIEKLKVCYEDRVREYSIPGNSIFTLHRDRFDYKLTKLACQNGAKLIDGEEVIEIEEENNSLTVKTNLGHKFKTRYLIGADGVGSKIARFIGSKFRYRIPLAIQKDIPYKDPEPTISLFMGLVPMGYGWIFPKDDTLSIGIGAYSFSPRRMPQVLSKLLKDFDRKDIPILAHPIAFYRGKKRLATKNVILVGDSAHIADPFSGEGIRNGIKSAKIAEETITECIKKNKPLSFYTERLYNAMARELFLAWMMSGIFYKFQGRIFNLMDRFDMGTILSNLLNEKISYLQILKKLLKRIFYRTYLMVFS